MAQVVGVGCFRNKEFKFDGIHSWCGVRRNRISYRLDPFVWRSQKKILFWCEISDLVISNVLDPDPNKTPRSKIKLAPASCVVELNDRLEVSRKSTLEWSLTCDCAVLRLWTEMCVALAPRERFSLRITTLGWMLRRLVHTLYVSELAPTSTTDRTLKK